MIDETNPIENDLASNLKPGFLSQVNILGLEPNSLSSPSQLGHTDYLLENFTEIPLQSKVQVNSIPQHSKNIVDTLTGQALNTPNSFTSTAASYQTLATFSAITPVNYAIKAQGLVTFNGQSNLDINPLDPYDDALIYAGLGYTINGNTTLAVQRGVNGQPLTNSQGKFLLVDKALVVAAGYQQATVNGNNNYANLTSPQIVPAENVNLPTYNSLKTEALANYNTANPTIVNINQSPINNATQWTQKFPNGLDSNNPKIIRVKGGSLSVPTGVNLSNLIITVESGDLNFNGSGQQLKNVTLITEQGSINLSSVSAENITVLSNNNIYSNGNIQFKGDNLFANSKNTGVINFNGQTYGDNNGSSRLVMTIQ